MSGRGAGNLGGPWRVSRNVIAAILSACGSLIHSGGMGNRGSSQSLGKRVVLLLRLLRPTERVDSGLVNLRLGAQACLRRLAGASSIFVLWLGLGLTFFSDECLHESVAPRPKLVGSHNEHWSTLRSSPTEHSWRLSAPLYLPTSPWSTRSRVACAGVFCGATTLRALRARGRLDRLLLGSGLRTSSGVQSGS